jgi:HEAT repeat protein
MTCTDGLGNQLDELIEFLRHENSQIRLTAAEYLLSFSVGDVAPLLKEVPRIDIALRQLHLCLSDEIEIAHACLKLLVQLSTDSSVRVRMHSEEMLSRLIGLILVQIVFNLFLHCCSTCNF